MKDTAILIVIACIFIVLTVAQIAISATDLVYVNVREGDSVIETSSEKTSSTIKSDLININTASESLLCEITGIGEVKAQSIIEYREKNGPFTCVEDLLKVKGIGEATLEKIRQYITV